MFAGSCKDSTADACGESDIKPEPSVYPCVVDGCGGGGGGNAGGGSGGGLGPSGPQEPKELEELEEPIEPEEPKDDREDCRARAEAVIEKNFEDCSKQVSIIARNETERCDEVKSTSGSGGLFGFGGGVSFQEYEKCMAIVAADQNLGNSVCRSHRADLRVQVFDVCK